MLYCKYFGLQTVWIVTPCVGLLTVVLINGLFPIVFKLYCTFITQIKLQTFTALLG
jgi:hypothetical protein